MTKDGGATWLDRTAKLAAAGGPANFWVSRVLPSPHAAGTAFVTKTGWRLDDYRVSIHKTTDFGETWTSIAGNLPAGKPVNVVIQDRKNADLLFAGTEWGVYVTLDGGTTWLPFKAGMPSVKVTDLVIHPRENDLVVATYGRGLYVVDISPLQEMTAGVLDEDVHLFDIEPRTQRVTAALGNYQLLGDSHLLTPNEPNAFVVNYYLQGQARGPGQGHRGRPRRRRPGRARGQGRGRDQHRELGHAAPPARPEAGPGVSSGFGGGPRLVAPGEYVVTLEAAGKKLVKKAVIRYRQGWTVGPTPVVIR